MAQVNSYLIVLLDSLRKKNRILELLLQKAQEQTVILSQEDVDADAFDQNVSDKADLIDQLTRLDEGFEQVYERVRVELLEQKAQYAGEIREMQELIAMITDKSVSIQTMEQRNYRRAEEYFQTTRRQIHQARMTSRVADSYHSSMSGVPGVQPTRIDQKK